MIPLDPEYAVRRRRLIGHLDEFFVFCSCARAWRTIEDVRRECRFEFIDVYPSLREAWEVRRCPCGDYVSFRVPYPGE
jgi:hypothetical protein